MLVLLDHGTPVLVARYLPHHTVRTASQQGWATLGNGELLAVAETDGFDVFVTTDKNFALPAEPFSPAHRRRGRDACVAAR